MKFRLEISLGTDMVSADDIATALESSARKIRENGSEALFIQGEVLQVRDERGKTVGFWEVSK